MSEKKPEHDDLGAELRASNDPNDPYFLADLQSIYYARRSGRSVVTYTSKHVVTDDDWSDLEQLQLEVLRLRDELIGALAREGEVRARLDGLRNSEARWEQHNSILNHSAVVEQRDDLQVRLDTVLNSRTWRVGRAILAPFRLFRSPSGSKEGKS